jgi:Spy/CpxP family protein refolding chaperone
MIPSLRRQVLALALALSFSTAASAQPLQWFWWKMEPTLALSTEQSSQIENIFQEGIGQLQKQKDELDRLEAKLSRLIETSASEAEVTHQIDHVEAVRSTLNKTRTLMLLHMRLVLKPDQRLKLNALRDRREQERKAQDQQLQQQRAKPRLSPDPTKQPDSSRKRLN